MDCKGEILDYACGWEPEGPHCPSGYVCLLIEATGEYVCYDKLDFGWRRRRRRNENKKDNGKTGKIYVRAKWSGIRPSLVSGFSNMKQ